MGRLNKLTSKFVGLLVLSIIATGSATKLHHFQLSTNQQQFASQSTALEPLKLLPINYIAEQFIIRPPIIPASGNNPIDAARLPSGSATLPESVWAAAGVVGGIPSGSWANCNNAACNAIAPGGVGSVTAATINAAVSGAQVGGVSCGVALPCVVRIRAITATLTTGLLPRSYVAIRGAGADQTVFTMSGANGCNGDKSVAVCIMSVGDYYASTETQPGGIQAATWVSGFAKGTTQIVLNNIGATGIAVGQYLYLDQDNDTATNSGFFVCENKLASPPCSAEGGDGDPGRVISGIAHQQVQIVKVTACSPSCNNGSTFTITPGLYAGNWSGSKHPGAWWPSSQITMTGVEDISFDISSIGTDKNGVTMMNANNVWVSGVRVVKNCDCSRSSIQMWQVTHATVQNNYIYGQQGQSVSYGVETYIASDILVMNNIIQHLPAPFMFHANTGSAYLYNFTINNTYDDGGSPLFHWQIQSMIGHSGGVMFNLIEGNVANGGGADAVHGNAVLNTAFRNRFTGLDVNRIDNTYAVMFEAWARYWNLVGNVLGTSGYHTTYATLTGSPPTSVYSLGQGRATTGDDGVLASTLLRWGNWDVVTSTNDNGTNDSTGTRFVSSEVPTTAPTYPNAVPSTQTLPNSYYFAARPTWWPSGKAWPLIGPDVANGNLTNTGGHANTNPAQDCYLNVMGGPADGTGSPLSFNAATCYP
jgi:hypothetical protein